MSERSIARIRRAVDEGLPPGSRTLLAVSGGIDSMVLLDAALAVRPPRDLVVANFDHASGPHSTRAADLVERVAMAAQVAVVIGRGEAAGRPSEASWRAARLSFLRAAAAEHRATICMAHTRDDQVETVLFREMRGAGTRGLAGLAVRGSVIRPLLGVGRTDVADYARACGVEWVDDPTNDDRMFARNRLRHDIIPALRGVCPAFESDLVAIGDRAAAWRADVESFLDARIEFSASREDERLDVSLESLAGHSEDALGIIWQALLGRIGLAADWRGTRRLVAFTTRASTGQRIQLSGGWTVHRRRGRFEVGRESGPTE